MKKSILYLAACALIMPFTACDDDDEINIVREYPEDNVIPHRDAPGFAFGADPSWVTVMEASGWTFRDANGQEGDCLEILKGIGFNACRLRVWVNPEDGYCGTNDMVRKAIRAYDLGYSIMIDFHYSDSWADPGQQYKPSVWDGCTSVDDLSDKLYAYTKRVLTAVQVNGVDVSWVQIGNETRTGMMKVNSDGSATDVNGEMGPNFAKLFASGCKAAKEVFPNCKTIMHIDEGQTLSRLEYALNTLKTNNADLDILGVSLYPDFTADGWYATYVTTCIKNLNTINEKYGCDVMVCEVGCGDIESDNAKIFLNDVVVRCQQEVPSCKGVFYWEPECYDPGYGGWNGYKMGGFSSDGSPSDALINAFSGKATTVMGK